MTRRVIWKSKRQGMTIISNWIMTGPGIWKSRKVLILKL